LAAYYLLDCCGSFDFYSNFLRGFKCTVQNRYGKEVNIPRDSKKYLEVLRAYREKRWPEKFRKVA
jgi:hypothetical protein